MRENRTYGSEGGEAKSLPYPYRPRAAARVIPTRSAGPSHALRRIVLGHIKQSPPFIVV
jgi:hypothetical protein